MTAGNSFRYALDKQYCSYKEKKQKLFIPAGIANKELYSRKENPVMKEMNLKTRTARRPLSKLSKVTIAALVINLCAQLFGFFIQWLAFGIVSIPLLIISVLLLIVIGLVIATGKRWSLLLSVLMVLATSVLTLTRPGNSYSLLHPTDPGSHFVPMAVLLVSAVVAVVAGIAAAMLHDAGSRQFASREQEEVRP